MGRDPAALRCLLNDSWLLLSAEAGAAPPPPEIRRMFLADAVNAPDTAVRCRALMKFLGPQAAAWLRMFATPGVAPETPGTSQPEQLDVEQAARMLNLKPHSVRSAIRRGKLPARKNNQGAWMIDLKGVEQYAAR